MKIFGYTLIKTSALNDLREYIAKLQCELEDAKKNDHRDPVTKRFKKAPPKKCGKKRKK